MSIEKRPFLGLQHNSRNSGQILPFRAPKGQMGQKRLISIEKRPFFGLQHNSRKSGQLLPFWAPKGQSQKRPMFIEKRPFVGLQHNSRKSGQILPFRAPKGQMSQKRREAPGRPLEGPGASRPWHPRVQESRRSPGARGPGGPPRSSEKHLTNSTVRDLVSYFLRSLRSCLSKRG